MLADNTNEIGYNKRSIMGTNWAFNSNGKMFRSKLRSRVNLKITI